MKIKYLMKMVAMALCFVSFSFTYALAQGFNSLSDCLVTNDIGKFTYEIRNARLGNAAGVVGGADHFKYDHIDAICTGAYSNNNEIKNLPLEEAENKLLSVDVQVTQHAGGDSDRWLLHEIEDAYRTSKDEKLGLPSQGTRLREINGNKIIGMRGSGYTWVSNNVVIDISYTDLDGTKPEPLEIVQAYLAKFPSTITVTDADFKSDVYNIKWIKDEMDRRLWLCDKWNAQYQAGKATQDDLIDKLVNNMEEFLNYRRKYYDGATADTDLNLLSGYKQSNDLASIQTKLAEYKAWWTANKSKSISLTSNNTNNTWKKYAMGGGVSLAAGIGLAVYFLRRS